MGSERVSQSEQFPHDCWGQVDDANALNIPQYTIRGYVLEEELENGSGPGQQIYNS